MVVSVKESSANPYYNLFEENESGYLQVSKGKGVFVRRQDAPKVWEYNGSIYVINVKSLKQTKMSDFTKKIKYCMPDIYSIDIDTPFDWTIAESILKMNLV
jgi:N-acylneuraminate cytidylyltransferase